MAQSTQQERTAVVACMRNEGMFVLEWLAFHLCTGFDEALVVTNDCTDGSDVLLDLMGRHAPVHHIAQVVPGGAAPQDAGMDHALDWARRRGVAWMLHIDSDEFLNIRGGDGRLEALLAGVRHADVVALVWRAFGDSGLRDWTPGQSVLRTNLRAEPAPQPGTAKFKCLFRPDRFAAATDHNPREPLIDAPVVVNADGAELSNRSLYQTRSSRFRPAELACGARAAVLHHYAVRAEDVFLMKNDRGDGQGKTGETKYHIGSAWHRSINRNEVEDRSILRHWPEVAALLQKWRADPAIAAAEGACHAWFDARRDQVLTRTRRAEWTRQGRTRHSPHG